MGVEDFQNFINQKCPGAFVSVDLLKVAQAIGVKQRKVSNANSGRQQQHSSLNLVIDGECCLDRLYGGYFNDWACGGQWNRMLQFLQLLLTTMHGNQIHVVVFFNGTLELERLNHWSKTESSKLDKVVQIMRHIRRRRTPPPKVLWVPPAALRCSLKLALRHLMIPVYQTVEDHKREVMSFLRQHEFDALLVEGIEYAFFDPPRYFSAESLKLTFRGNLETKELILDEVAKQLDLHPNRFSLFAALLGNFVMPQEELMGFYEELFVNVKLDKEEDLHRLIQALLAFVRNLATIDDLPAIGQFIFRHLQKESERNEKANRFVRSAQYYMNASTSNENHFGQFASESKGGELHDVPSNFATQVKPLAPADYQSLQNEMSSLSVVADDATDHHNDSNTSTSTANSVSAVSTSYCSDVDNSTTSPTTDSLSSIVDKTTSSSDDIIQVAKAAICAKNAIQHIENCSNSTNEHHSVPEVPSEVLRVNFDRHQKGSMHPWIHHCLTKAVVKIDCYLEEGPELPYGWQLWRPVRQRVYAVLFNLNHRLFLSKQEREASGNSKDVSNSNASKNNITGISNNCTTPKPGKEPGKYPSDLTTRICIKEWICIPKRNLYQQSELVPAVPLEWKGVPTVQRLWFGRQPEDKKKRLRTFLQCMGADTNLMLDTNHVPQHLLLLCCVLKHMLTYSECRVLQRHELDAFLAQAVSPQLMDPNSLQELQIKTLTPRGIHLAQLFMQGVEHAFFANDACGAPIPWVTCCPWLYFDGKLFQSKLDIAETKRNPLELCGGQAEQLSQVERMRLAILEGFSQIYTQPVITIPAPGGKFPNVWLPSDVAQRYAAAAAAISRDVSHGCGRGMIGRRDILTRGGQLEVAGVVVGQWGGQQQTGDKNKQTRSGGGGLINNFPQVLQSPLPGAVGRGSRPLVNIASLPPPPLYHRPMQPAMPPDFCCQPGVFSFGSHHPHQTIPNVSRSNFGGRTMMTSSSARNQQPNHIVRGVGSRGGGGVRRGCNQQAGSAMTAPRYRNQGNRTGQSKTAINQNQQPSLTK